MEWKDVLDMGLGAVAFVAFLKLVFRDMADLRQRLERLEDQARRQNYYLSRLVNAVEAQALRQGLRLRSVKEVQDGE
jgi:septal ring factor EnvC (AmiA/AmiB activator)